MTGHSLKAYKFKREMTIAKLGGKCEKCGSIVNLEFHTIDGTGENRSGGWQKLTQVLRDVDRGNIKLLCRPCHFALHMEQGTYYHGREMAHDEGNPSEAQ